MEITPTELAERIEEWGKRLAPLGVAHWHIESVGIVSEVPCEDGRDSEAAVQVSNKYDTCTFWFRDSFVEEATEDELDETIIHEWLHVAWRDLSTTVAEAQRWMPATAYEHYDSRVDHETEGVVDRTARTLLAFFNGTEHLFTP